MIHEAAATTAGRAGCKASPTITSRRLVMIMQGSSCFWPLYASSLASCRCHLFDNSRSAAQQQPQRWSDDLFGAEASQAKADVLITSPV
jgi:hypothetical protein